MADTHKDWRTDMLEAQLRLVPPVLRAAGMVAVTNSFSWGQSQPMLMRPNTNQILQLMCGMFRDWRGKIKSVILLMRKNQRRAEL